MPDTSPIIARQLAQERRKVQPGTVLSFTTLTHPPEKFGPLPRTIGMIQLADGSKVMAPLLGTPSIGASVIPRMRLKYVTEEALRVYETAYEVVPAKPVADDETLDLAEVFPGYILALTGPSGVGKTTISRKLVTIFSSSTENVPILTTRGPKPGDDGEYQYVSRQEFETMRKNGEIVAATQIPSSTEERWYGYRSTDIEAIWMAGKLPIVITEMHLLEELAQHYGRRSILSFGLLPPGHSKRAMISALLHRLRDRGRETEEQIRDRLENAERDLAFVRERADLFDHLVTNDDLDAVMALFKKKVPALERA